MKLDWFTVVAQVCNFLLLVWLLRKFLYKPILDAIDHREQQVVDEVQQADKKEKEAAQLLAEYEQKKTQLEQQKNLLLDQAKGEAKNEKDLLLKLAHEEMDVVKKQWREDWNRQLLKVEQQFIDNGKTQVVSMVKAALKELANITLEDYMIRSFISHLQNSEPTDLEKFKSSGENILITTPQSLTKEQQQILEEAIVGQMKTQLLFQYRVSTALISGIEVSSGQYKISWTASQYLNSLDEQMKLFIDRQTKEAIA